MNHNSPNNYLSVIAAKAHVRAAQAMHNLKVADDGPVHLGSDDTFLHFRSISSSEIFSGNYTRPVTVTDIETGNNDQVISVAAVKGVIDKRTGEFRVLDTFERYYTPEKTYSASFNMSREVHGLTHSKITSLRNTQASRGEYYGEKYDRQEASDLMKFMRGSLVVGHNVEEFDFARLGIAQDLQKEDILDTLVWAENAGIKKGHRGLAKVFKSMTGRTLKQAGYSHHFGFHDVLSNAELFSAIYKVKGKVGRDVRFVTNKRGYSYGAYEDAMGTAVIKGGYYLGRGPGGLNYYMHEDDDEFNEESVLGWDYDDNGQKKLPEGYSWSDELMSDGDMTGGYGTLMMTQLADQYRAMREALLAYKESTIGFKVHQQQQLMRYVASMDEKSGKEYLKRLAYSKKDIESMMTQIMPLRYAKEKKQAERKQNLLTKQRESAASLVEHMHRTGDITEADYLWLRDVNDDSAGFSAQDIAYMAKERKADLADRRRRVQERKKAEQDLTFDNLKSFVRDLNEQSTPEIDRSDTARKLKYLDNIQKKKLITEEQRASLELVGSYEDVVDATEDVIAANQRLAKVYQTLGNIKPYDVNQFIHSAEGQWGSIKHAAHGVISGFIRNPLSRLGDAAFNSANYYMAPWNAAGRIFGAVVPSGGGKGGEGGIIGGGGLTGGIGGWAKFKAGLGIFNGGTQVVGNVAQAKMEMMGYSIQNNLNTLGAMISWISAPFQLLHKALKLAIGSLSGFTFKINSFMGNGIGLMSQMGNPLTNLTGIDYSSYMGTTMMDVASLLGKGTVNKAIESNTTQQQMFYTMGQVDTNRLVASSLLGVYGDVYTPNQDPHQQYMNIANKLIADMKSNPASRARIMSLAPLISGELAQMIQTADLLGVDDVSILADPSKRGMYWNPVSQDESSRFRWTQYEYGASKEQFGVSKMRLANTLWRAGGKQIYGAFNELVDAAATGHWDTVLKKATDMWTTFRDRFNEVWKGLQGAIGADEDNSLVKGIKAIGLQIENVVIAGGLKILDVWNSVMAALADKMAGALSYLSTVKITPHWDLKNGVTFSVDTIDTAKVPGRSAQIYDTRTNNLGKIVSQEAYPGMEGYAMLADVLYGEDSSYKKSFLTPEDLKSATFQYLLGDEDKAIDLPEYGLTGFRSLHSEDIDELLDMLGKGETGDKLLRKSRRAAALYRANLNSGTKDYDQVGIGKAVRQFSDDTMDVVSTLLGDKYNENKARVEILFRDATGKKAMIEADSDGNVVSKNMNLLSQMVPNVANMAVNLIKG